MEKISLLVSASYKKFYVDTTGAQLAFGNLDKPPRCQGNQTSKSFPDLAVAVEFELITHGTENSDSQPRSSFHFTRSACMISASTIYKTLYHTIEHSMSTNSSSTNATLPARRSVCCFCSFGRDSGPSSGCQFESRSHFGLLSPHTLHMGLNRLVVFVVHLLIGLPFLLWFRLLSPGGTGSTRDLDIGRRNSDGSGLG